MKNGLVGLNGATQRDVVGGENRTLEALVDAVLPGGLDGVFALEERLVGGADFTTRVAKARSAAEGPASSWPRFSRWWWSFHFGREGRGWSSHEGRRGCETLLLPAAGAGAADLG